MARTVDLTAELGPGWALTQTAQAWPGEWEVRLDGHLVGVLRRRRNVTGTSTTGWEATREGRPVTTGTGTSWPTRGQAAATPTRRR